MNEEYNNKQVLEDEKQIDLRYWTTKSLEIKSLVIKKAKTHMMYTAESSTTQRTVNEGVLK